MNDRDTFIFGERRGDLFPGFETLVQNMQPNSDGSFTVDAELSAEDALPFNRALYRAEAQLLLDDAEALREPSARPRTPEQRRFDALMCVVRGFKATTA